jgi:cyclopropane fatty-acyl-phospholipid synthase-like methyltransferase
MGVENWRLDELAHAGQEHLDPQYVAGYERKAGYDPADDIAILCRHGLNGDSTIIDLGTGTGRFTVEVAAHCREVIAVDVSPPMTALLRRRIAELGIGNVTVVEAGFLSYQHSHDLVGFVFSRNALHQLPDFWKGIALSRIAAMMAPGGILRLHDLVFDFEPSQAEQRIPAWMAGAVEDPTRGWTAGELAEHVRIEHSTYSWLFEPMLERTGFQILDRSYVRGAYGAFTCRRT